MFDAIVVGAGPAGSVAATVLARAGARVCLLDRAAFPRHKLCGDTLNPGTLGILRRLGMAASIDRDGLRVDGMIVTGEGGVMVPAPYPGGLHGRALVRRDLDAALVEHAIGAGAAFEPLTPVRRARVDADGSVAGVVVGMGRGREAALDAPVVIAADGRHSTIAFGLGLARHPDHPRRWAVGGYFEDVCAAEVAPDLGRDSAYGEMHIRPGGYVGIAPVPGGLTNVCVVRPMTPGLRLDDPEAFIRGALCGDRDLAGRFASARLVERPVVLGPLAVDASPCAIPGVLVAGDAAGFIDPMTGDGLRFAVRGGELAAHSALDVLANGWAGVHARLSERRQREFAGKRRFNRALRGLVSSPAAVNAGRLVAALAPGLLRAVVRHAGDCALA